MDPNLLDPNYKNLMDTNRAVQINKQSEATMYSANGLYYKLKFLFSKFKQST